MSKDIKDLSFEEALSELESIVNSLEQGDISLDKSVEYYERGELLKKRCAELLKSVEDKVEKIRVDSTGKPTGTQSMDDF